MTQPTEILPLAPLPPPRQLSEQERLHLEEQEEDVLRELRLFLRNVTERLTLDRRFKAFTKPVDIEEVSGFCEEASTYSASSDHSEESCSLGAERSVVAFKLCLISHFQ